MNKRYYTTLANAQTALKILRHYNQYVIYPVSDEVFNDPLLVKCFESEFDDPIQKTAEKVLSVAAMRAVNDNPNIPESRKEVLAKKNACEIRDVWRLSILEYQANVKGTVFHKQYLRLKKAIPIATKVARVKQLKKIANYLTVRGLAELIGGPLIGGAVMVGRFVWKLMPEKARKTLVEIGQEVKEEALNVIENCYKYIKSTRVGQAVERAVKKVTPLVNKVTVVIKAKAQEIEDKVKAWYHSLISYP